MIRFIGALGCALSLSLSTAVQSAPIIAFNNGSTSFGGTIVRSGGHVTGKNILIDTLTVTGTPNDGVYDVSGALVSATGVGGTAGDLDFDTAANTITITGGVTALGIPDGTVLLNGSFASFSFVIIRNFAFFDGAGPDAKHPDLLEALGLSPTTPFDFLGNLVGLPTLDRITFTGFFTNITNFGDPGVSGVPEPGSWLLLGTGLVALSGLSRKKKARLVA